MDAKVAAARVAVAGKYRSDEPRAIRHDGDRCADCIPHPKEGAYE